MRRGWFISADRNNGSLTQRFQFQSSQSTTHILNILFFFWENKHQNRWIVPPCNQSSDVLDSWLVVSNTSPCIFPPFRVSEVTLLFVCRGDPCRISGRWIIHNPECMMLLLALNPLYWMSQVVFPGSGVKRLHLFHASLNTSTEKNDRWCYCFCVAAPCHIITHPHNTYFSITSSQPQCWSLMKRSWWVQPARRTFCSYYCLLNQGSLYFLQQHSTTELFTSHHVKLVTWSDANTEGNHCIWTVIWKGKYNLF